VHAGSTKESKTIDRTAADHVTKAFLANIHHKLQEAARIAKAAEVCAENGNVRPL
jgi:hypothetical protein